MCICPNDKPYVTAACRHADKVRDRWHRRFRKTANPLHYEMFKEKRTTAKLTRSLAKIAYHEKIINRLNGPVTPKDYWKIAKSLLGQKAKSGIPTLKDNGNLYVTSIEKAYLLNEFFADQSTIVDPPRALPPLRFLTHARLDNLIVSESNH